MSDGWHTVAGKRGKQRPASAKQAAPATSGSTPSSAASSAAVPVKTSSSNTSTASSSVSNFSSGVAAAAGAAPKGGVPAKQPPASSQPAAAAGPGRPPLPPNVPSAILPLPVCPYFLAGNCQAGARCPNRHPQTPSSALGSSASASSSSSSSSSGTASSTPDASPAPPQPLPQQQPPPLPQSQPQLGPQPLAFHHSYPQARLPSSLTGPSPSMSPRLSALSPSGNRSLVTQQRARRHASGGSLSTIGDVSRLRALSTASASSHSSALSEPGTPPGCTTPTPSTPRLLSSPNTDLVSLSNARPRLNSRNSPLIQPLPTPTGPGPLALLPSTSAPLTTSVSPSPVSGHQKRNSVSSTSSVSSVPSSPAFPPSPSFSPMAPLTILDDTGDGLLNPNNMGPAAIAPAPVSRLSLAGPTPVSLGPAGPSSLLTQSTPRTHAVISARPSQPQRLPPSAAQQHRSFPSLSSTAPALQHQQQNEVDAVSIASFESERSVASVSSGAVGAGAAGAAGSSGGGFLAEIADSSVYFYGAPGAAPPSDSASSGRNSASASSTWPGRSLMQPQRQEEDILSSRLERLSFGQPTGVGVIGGGSSILPSVPPPPRPDLPSSALFEDFAAAAPVLASGSSAQQQQPQQPQQLPQQQQQRASAKTVNWASLAERLKASSGAAPAPSHASASSSSLPFALGGGSPRLDLLSGGSSSASFGDRSGPEFGAGLVSGAPGSAGEICEFFLQGICRYGAQCRYVHAFPDEYCPQCGERVGRSPIDHQEHMRSCRELLLANEERKASYNEECGICFTKVMQAGRRFGLLTGCNHAFCLECIREWRGSADPRDPSNKQNVRLCPICRVESFFVVPCDRLVTDPVRKKQIIDEYKARLVERPCKHFNYGKGVCPFGDSCFYAHVNEDGTPADASANVVRTRANADGVVEIVRGVQLSDFLF